MAAPRAAAEGWKRGMPSVPRGMLTGIFIGVEEVGSRDAGLIADGAQRGTLDLLVVRHG